MNPSVTIAIFCFVAFLQHTTAHKQDFCIVMQKVMCQYCSAEGVTGNGSQNNEVPDGCRGIAGPQGPPGEVNYTLVEEKMKKINRGNPIYEIGYLYM